MYTIDEYSLADNRTLITIQDTKMNIDPTVKNGTINYTADTGALYLTIPTSLTYGEYNQILQIDSAGQQIPTGGDIVFTDKVIMNGGLLINGEATEVLTTKMTIEDNIIELNVGETGAGITLGTAGLRIDRGTSTAASLIYKEGTGWMAGLEGAEIALMTANNATASAIAYTNPAYPSLDNVQEALDTLLYVPPQITSISNNVGTVEIGQTITAVTLNWALNKTLIVSQTWNNGIGSVPIDARTYSLTGLSLTADKTYTLTVVDEKNTVSSSTYIQFRNKRYWGVSANESLSNVDILAMNKEFSTSRSQSRVFDCTGGKYFFFAWPSTFGTPTFKINGLTNTAFIKTTQSFTNASGYTTNYDVWRCQYLQNGSGINVDVS